MAINPAWRPDTAFILAAGEGRRLRPYTDNIPKPMVAVNGRPIIDQALDHLAAANVKNVFVNLHYKGDVLQEHLSKQNTVPHLFFSAEDELLDTGGGVKKMIPQIGDDAFYVLNGDALWTDGETAALDRMAMHWNPDIMDILILLQPVNTMVLTQGFGDYTVTEDGRAIRSHDKSGTHMWTSIRICKPEIFSTAPDGAFSFLKLLDEAETKGRLYALEHDADWHHISTPADLERVDKALNRQQKTA